ncbi:MAG TPA: late competence development ComFB family protein [Spirochaetota bacterium]|nr:late competence development ComFB family protein [Spirochaetota bacterium]HQO01165.1 late competence development ComFB family protein [Spirochaetota bacterium]HQP47729.1 late competence development ComFB family protein [Spirochaetota bacterium]
MAIRNLMEDVTASVVGEVLSRMKEELPHSDMYWDDVIAYVLNRIPAKYVTSERGILHDRLDALTMVQQKSDILFLAHEAILHIKNRRTSTGNTNYDGIREGKYFFPHILGEVLEESSFAMIPDVEVTLLFGKEKTSMIDNSWTNPYVTNKATRGYFHFWPDFVEGAMDSTKPVQFSIVFSHPKFKEKRIDLSLSVQETFKLNSSHVIPLTLMNTLDGVDIAFLYE